MKEVNSLVIIGAQWGDEGKGKITDFLSDKADAVVRYQGGSNAGHTVVVGSNTYKLHLIPSGVIGGKTSIIGAGMAFDPVWYMTEAEELESQGLDTSVVIIDKRANIVMPWHKTLDVLSEEFLGQNDIGTTQRGIGPAYTDKTARNGIRVCDWIDDEVFLEKLQESAEIVNRTLAGVYQKPPIDCEAVHKEYAAIAKRLAPSVADASVLIDSLIREGKKVLFEGAQGTLLDVDFGTYPYVTSSHPTSAGVCIGVGIGPALIGEVLGIAKAYTTRVGKGPFPTELYDETGDFLRQNGLEYGTTTGRARRCGWLDTVILKYAARVNSLTSLALTKLDTLTGIDVLKICTGYHYNNEVITDFPAEMKILAGCEPVYEELEGWTQDITGAKFLTDLPGAAREYVRRVEELTSTPIGIVSVGPGREQTILVRDYFS